MSALWAVYPLAVVLSITYTEALFTFLSAWALLALRVSNGGLLVAASHLRASPDPPVWYSLLSASGSGFPIAKSGR